jgi:hypothetical protein
LSGALQPSDDAMADPHVELRDLTPDAGRALDSVGYDISADGATVVTTWNVPERAGYRETLVPIGEALRLWFEIASRAEAEDGEIPHRFLYFPDENHWIFSPQHAKVWYDTVFAFLAHNVLGEQWATPAILR